MKDEKGRQLHIHSRAGDVGRYVLLPGDPGRCELIAQHFEAPIRVAANREYVTYTGTLMGEPVSVTSTGIGGPSTAIAVEELAAIGADTFIRVGTSGGMQPHTWPGDLVVATAAVRDEGTTSQYIPLAYPAVAHVDVVAALRHAAGDLGGRYHAGIVHSKDSFYGEVEPGRMPIGERLRARWRAWVRGNVLCSEMEAAALFVVASILGKRAGGLMLVVVNVLNLDDLGPLGPEDRDRILSMQQQPIPSLDGLINTAIVGLKVLIRMDQERA